MIEKSVVGNLEDGNRIGSEFAKQVSFECVSGVDPPSVRPVGYPSPEALSPREEITWNVVMQSPMATPVRGVKMPERVPKYPRTFLNGDEARRLIAALGEPVRTIVLLAMLTGLRIGEILALRWGRVDLQAKTLRVEETCYKGVFGTPKTRASRREVPLAQAVVQALTAHARRRLDTSPDALVFSTKNGTPFAADNLRKKAFVPACRHLGLKSIGWHSFRRTYATLMHAQGTPLKVAQVLLGHSDIGVTLEAYTHTMTDSQREAVVKLEQVLFPNVPKLGESQEGSQSETQLIR